ncbi:1-acyl-sn-glycerol-3-phosphate acyltransferase [Endozoicomonas ascidiicola]|uniref:1-acyl-sn-glycerol-3-phosphate acyltransferase n=1 Tax=Endozoicomonas ascidiicola TaxID=1698521 RepID=UPI0008316FBB|nr:1-acyl-sn-glycerol-3-phosphate acyltransferase [Endozoicomonas ascidiicola]
MLYISKQKNNHFIRKLFQDSFFRVFMSCLDKKLETHLDGFVGSNNIPKDGAVIITPNHQSYFDGFVITGLLWKLIDRKVKIPTNIKALRNPVFRECQIAGGAVPIDPSDTDKTYSIISDLLHSGNAVVMYPEGTRSDGTFLHPFKYGAFNLAVEHNIPILPVAINNFSNVLPKGSLQFNKGEKGYIVFGELISPSDKKFQGLTDKQIAHQIKNQAYDWILEHTIEKNKHASIEEEVTHLSNRVDLELELLLDQNVDLISKDDVARVKKLASTKWLLPKSCFEMNVQDIRIEGFKLNTMPKPLAIVRMKHYINMLNSALGEDKNHPYLNYCKGLLIQKSPQFYRKKLLNAELNSFKRAYHYGSQYGYPTERFAYGLAKALHANGQNDKALSLLHHCFCNQKHLNTIRQLRRKERGLSLMNKIERESINSPKFLSRPLQGFEAFMAQSRISDIVIGQIEGIESFEQVREAAIALHRRHPQLRAKVVWPKGHDSRPEFQFLPVNSNKVHVSQRLVSNEEQDHTTLFWETVANEEVNHIFDLSDGYMFRVTWLPESGHIILNAQHSVVDGLSLMNLLNEFITHCAGNYIGESLPPTPSALELSPKVGLIERCIGALHRNAFLRARSKYESWAEIKPQGQLKPGELLKTNCFFAESSRNTFKNVIRECKKQGVTVGSLYAAAIQCALLHFSGSKLENKQQFSLPMDFSLRRYFNSNDASVEAVGYLSGSGASQAQAFPTMTFWELAKEFGEGAKEEVEMRSPLIFHKVFDRFWNAEKTYKKYELDCINSGGAGATVTMSNVGRYKHKTQVGSIRLKSFHGMSASQRAGAMLYCWLRSVDDKFCYSFTSISPALDKDSSAEFFGYVVFLLNYSTSEYAKQKAIKEYIPVSAKIYKENEFISEIEERNSGVVA